MLYQGFNNRNKIKLKRGFSKEIQTFTNSSSKLSIRRCCVLTFPIRAGISFFRWPIMYAWIFAALARFTNSFICGNGEYRRVLYVRWHTNSLKDKLSLKLLTLRSQAFLGMSFKSAKRSSCSLSKSSFPIGPTAPLVIGLSLNDLSKKLHRTMMLSACAC